jgi:hypothetical protein
MYFLHTYSYARRADSHRCDAFRFCKHISLGTAGFKAEAAPCVLKKCKGIVSVGTWRAQQCWQRRKDGQAESDDTYDLFLRTLYLSGVLRLGHSASNRRLSRLHRLQHFPDLETVRVLFFYFDIGLRDTPCRDASAARARILLTGTYCCDEAHLIRVRACPAFRITYATL